MALGAAWVIAHARPTPRTACGVWWHDPAAIAAARQHLGNPKAHPQLRVSRCGAGLDRWVWTGRRPYDAVAIGAPDEIRDERAALADALARSPIVDQPSDTEIDVDSVAVPTGSPAGRALMTVFERLEARDVAAATAAVAARELTLTLVADHVELRLTAPLRLERRDGDRWRPIALAPRDVLAILNATAMPRYACRYSERLARVTWRGQVRHRRLDGKRPERLPAAVEGMLRAPYAD